MPKISFVTLWWRNRKVIPKKFSSDLFGIKNLLFGKVLCYMVHERKRNAFCNILHILFIDNSRYKAVSEGWPRLADQFYFKASDIGYFSGAVIFFPRSQPQLV